MTDVDDFLDLMPHFIIAQPMTGRDDYGRLVADPDQVFYYHCLIQEQEVIMRSADSTSITVSLTAYVNPNAVRMDEVEGAQPPVIRPILKTDQVYVSSPEHVYDRPISSVASYFDETGNCHNLIVRFT